MTAYIVFSPSTVVVVDAPTASEARTIARCNAGFEHKPYIARDWVVRKATREEVLKYIAQADARGKSRPTAAVAKNPPKSVRDKLF